MSGNQDSQGLTGRSIDAIDQLLAEAVVRVARAKVVDEAQHARQLAALAAAARGVVTARAAEARAERLALKAIADIEAGETPEAGDEMNDTNEMAEAGGDLETKRATLFRELDAIIAGRAGGGLDARPGRRRDRGGPPALVADGAEDAGRELPLAAAA